MNWRTLTAALFVVSVLAHPAMLSAMDIVVDGKPVAVVVVSGGLAPADRRARSTGPGDQMAARAIVEWVKKMTGAELAVVDRAVGDGPAIYVGAAAVGAGLKLDDIESPSGEGLRVVVEDRRILLGGQNGTATVKAACRLLEELGCRYFMSMPLGEVYPRTSTVRISNRQITEKPKAILRSIWGSQWSSNDLWKIWNGAGGVELNTQHAWGQYVPASLFAEHPEYFALRNGKRMQGDWYCTSNAELRRVFAEGVIRAIESKGRNPSISPPDGVAYCQCDVCRAQDDPGSVEPSSGTVCVTNRYVDFFNDVARRVGAKRPEALLNFYCYADYTQAPTKDVNLEKNLVAWIAPLRYCRVHRIGHGDCPSRVQLEQMIAGWCRVGQKVAYRTYNYNLAECLAPYSMISVWKHDIPYLAERGCIAFNLETLPSWTIYGPHIYLSIRLAYDPKADADAIMEDYFAKFYGPKAGPIMKEYWMGIDRAFEKLDSHAGSFYAIHRVYTAEFLVACKGLLARAAEAAREDNAYAARVAMHEEGFKNAEQYVQLREALNAGRVQEAVATYRQLLARTEAQVKVGHSNGYTSAYLKRFVGTHVEAAAAAVNGKRLVMVLPDRIRFEVDPDDKGLAGGWAEPRFDDSAWRQVATYSDPLDAQGLADRKTILWYRVAIDVPAVAGKARLFFTEIDGTATVFVNGKQVGGSEKKRVPFEIDVSESLVAGRNVVAVRVDHSRITELFLGGIVRPVFLLAGRGE